MESISSLPTSSMTATQASLAKSTAWSKVSVEEGLVLQILCGKWRLWGEKITPTLQPDKSLDSNCLLVYIFTIPGAILSQALVLTLMEQT